MKMSSRDSRGPGGGRMKVLSRDDREGDRGREERDRDRRREDREGGRRREDRDRRRDRERESESSKPVQGPIVLLKRPDAKVSSASSATERDRGEQSSRSTSVSTTETSGSKHGPPSILVRSGKKEAEPVDQSNTEKGKQTGPPTITDILKPAYQFPSGHATTLIDSAMKMCSWKTFDYDVQNNSGNTDYLVVTAIGRPNVGKSTILSYLAGNDKFGKRNIFQPRSREDEMRSSVYISSDQIVYIELSSVYNQAATNDLIPLVSQQGVLEVSNVTWNLRLVRWALSISHVVLVVSENALEPNVFKLMNSAEIIHAMDSALGEGSYPEPIYVCNKADLELIDNTEVIQEFQKHWTSATGRKPRIEKNYFVLPQTKYEMEYGRFEDFKRSIMEFSRYNRAAFAPDKEGLAKLIHKHSIQDWFLNSSRLWDEMNLPSYFSSYVKLLP